MNEVEVKIVKSDLVALPTYATEHSVGFDFQAMSLKKLYNGLTEVDLSKLKNNLDKGYFTMRAWERCLIGTGIFVEIPVGIELNLRPRSGVSLKRGLVVIEGTIDSDYRGEIGIILMNNTKVLNRVTFGEFISQGVLSSHERVRWNVVTELSETARGEGGFGHTDGKLRT